MVDTTRLRIDPSHGTVSQRRLYPLDDWSRLRGQGRFRFDAEGSCGHGRGFGSARPGDRRCRRQQGPPRRGRAELRPHFRFHPGWRRSAPRRGVRASQSFGQRFPLYPGGGQGPRVADPCRGSRRWRLDPDRRNPHGPGRQCRPGQRADPDQLQPRRRGRVEAVRGVGRPRQDRQRRFGVREA